LADPVSSVTPGLTGTFFVKVTYRLQPDAALTACPEKPLAAAGDRLVGGDPKQGLACATDLYHLQAACRFCSGRHGHAQD